MFPPLRSSPLPDLIEDATGEVFHYTSPDGLIGMVQHGALWASEATTLSDLTEVRYGWDLVADWVEGQKQSDAVAEIRRAADSFGRRDRDVFVVSASMDGDDANQWRRYGADCRGYVVGLDASARLTVIAVNHEQGAPRSMQSGLPMGDPVGSVEVSSWLRVFYEPDLVAAALDQLLKSTEEALAAAAGADYQGASDEAVFGWHDHQSGIRSAVATIATLAKPAGLFGESEVRIVVDMSAGARHYCYRGSRDGVVPYVKLVGLPDGSASMRVVEPSEVVAGLPVQSVTLGPRLRDENIGATQNLLRRHGYDTEKIAVRCSDVPLR